MALGFVPVMVVTATNGWRFDAAARDVVPWLARFEEVAADGWPFAGDVEVLRGDAVAAPGFWLWLVRAPSTADAVRIMYGEATSAAGRVGPVVLHFLDDVWQAMVPATMQERAARLPGVHVSLLTVGEAAAVFAGGPCRCQFCR